jgi:Cytochrome c7 and related cytochrome c/Class III cytochrome C family
MKPWPGVVGIALLVPAVFVAAIRSDQAKSQAAQSPKFTVPANVAPHPPIAQPIPFSHKLHVGMGVPCETCHVNPQISSDMSLPPAETCMACHAEIAKDRPDIKKLAEFAASGKPIPWARVYPLLPGIQYSHAPHLHAQLECTNCHGPVPDQVAMSELTTLRSMATCIACHQASQAKAECVTCHSWPSNNPDLLGKWSVPAPLPLDTAPSAASSPR